jgi:hypothetical protein
MTEFIKELAAFEARKEELLELCRGKLAVFKESEFLGVFDTPQAAYEAGLNKWGNVPFLIKPVVQEEKPKQFPALCLGLLHPESFQRSSGTASTNPTPSPIAPGSWPWSKQTLERRFVSSRTTK